MLRKLLLPFLFVAFFASQAMAQTGSITGTVTNQDGESVPTANVLLVEIGRGDATNLEGQYLIKNVEPGTYTLRVTFVGYKDFTQQVTIEAGERTVVDVVLQASAVGLEELVVTGFGRQSKVEFSGSIAQVNTEEEIQNVPVVNVSTALQGSVTGLQISASTGTPGSQVDINIRGIGSINAETDPLIVIDGVPVTTGSYQIGDATSNIGLLSMINPATIKSVTVLKGPVATAQYGARGANGVIVITTKRGSPGETRFTFSMQRGTISLAVDGPESLTASQAKTLLIEGMKHAGFPKPVIMNVFVKPRWDGKAGTSTDWEQLIINENAVTQSYMFSASGGSETATFYAAFSYQSTDNIIINSNFERYQANVNFTYDFNENISISNQFSGSFGTQQGFLEGDAYFGNPMLTQFFMPSYVKAYNKDGSYNTTLPVSIFNTVFTTEKDISLTRTTRIINSTKLNIEITDNLAFHSEVGLDYSVIEEKLYRNPVHGDGADLGGTSEASYTRVFNGSLQNGLSYNWTINEDNSLQMRVVQSVQMFKYYRIYAYASGFPTKGLTNLASASVPRGAYSEALDGSIVSFLGKAHYGYKDKIFIDATVRYEGNSRFAKDYRWGLFYGVGVNWLISSEDFLSEADWLDLLKVSASYGVTGNDAVGRNEFQDLLGYGAAYANVGGIIPDQLGYIQLTWEESTEYNVNLRVGVFNRIDFHVGLFRAVSSNLLYEVPLSRTTGFNNQWRNVGKLLNQGIELSLDVDIIRTEDLLVNFSGNFTILQNEILDLAEYTTGEPIAIKAANFKWVAVEGYPIGSWYMKTYAGVNPQTGHALWQVNDNDGNPGELTSVYAKANAEYQGASGFPTKYGSISLTVNYKGFYASAELYGSFGNKVYDIWSSYMASDGAVPLFAFGGYQSLLQRWQEPGDHTDVPKRVFLNTTESNETSTRYLYDGDYLRLSTVRIGYNVPATLLDDLGLGVRGLNVYVVGRNLWTYTFDPELEFDPATGSEGRLDLQNPALQALTFGINIQF